MFTTERYPHRSARSMWVYRSLLSPVQARPRKRRPNRKRYKGASRHHREIFFCELGVGPGCMRCWSIETKLFTKIRQSSHIPARPRKGLDQLHASFSRPGGNLTGALAACAEASPPLVTITAREAWDQLFEQLQAFRCGDLDYSNRLQYRG